MRQLTVAYVNFWRDSDNDRYFTKFLRYHFRGVTIVEVDASKQPDIAICSVFGTAASALRVKAKIRIFYTGENIHQNKYKDYVNHLKSYDLIAGFDFTDLTKNKIRFPIWLLYYDFYTMHEHSNVVSFIEQEHKINRTNCTEFCSHISRHDCEQRIRSKICKSVSEVGKVCFGGEFCVSECGPRKSVGVGSAKKINFLKPFKYNICPENKFQEGYCTEKLFQALQSGCIPIYWGHAIPNELNAKKIVLYDPKGNKAEFHELLRKDDSLFEGNVFSVDAFDIISSYYDTLYAQICKLVKNKIPGFENLDRIYL